MSLLHWYHLSQLFGTTWTQFEFQFEHNLLKEAFTNIALIFDLLWFQYPNEGFPGPTSQWEHAYTCTYIKMQDLTAEKPFVMILRCLYFCLSPPWFHQIYWLWIRKIVNKLTKLSLYSTLPNIEIFFNMCLCFEIIKFAYFIFQ